GPEHEREAPQRAQAAQNAPRDEEAVNRRLCLELAGDEEQHQADEQREQRRQGEQTVQTAPQVFALSDGNDKPAWTVCQRQRARWERVVVIVHAVFRLLTYTDSPMRVCVKASARFREVLS